jgi:hypothetical protein
MKRCEWCEEVIENRRSNAVYCSDFCYREAKRIRDNEYYYYNRNLSKLVERSDAILEMFYRDSDQVQTVAYQSLKDAEFNFGVSTDETQHDSKAFNVVKRYCYRVIKEKQKVEICKLR